MFKNVIALIVTRREFFLELILQHLWITLISVAITTIIGLFLGVFMTKYKWLSKGTLFTISFLYTIPSIALLGVLVTATGIGNTSAIIALVIYGLLPMVRSTYAGLTSVDPDILDAANGMGVTEKQLFTMVRLPLALPIIYSGFRTMVIMTIALAGIASFIGAGGLGVAIWRGITTNFPEMIIAGSLLVALLAVVTDGILGWIQKKLERKMHVGGNHE